MELLVKIGSMLGFILIVGLGFATFVLIHGLYLASRWKIAFRNDDVSIVLRIAWGLVLFFFLVSIPWVPSHGMEGNTVLMRFAEAAIIVLFATHRCLQETVFA